jgi:hypothetical protein
MAIKRIYPSQDTSVTDFDPAYSLTTGTLYANVGAAEILNLYKYEVHRAEVLVQFPTSSIQASSSVFLHLADAQHDQTLPAGYTVYIRPLEQPWTEGDGLDIDTYTDVGQANFIYATTNVTWSLQTGTLSSSFYLTTGHEDIDVEVTHMTGAIGHGFDIMMDPFEPGDLYIKKFHSRQSHFSNKRPYLECRWTDWTGSLSTTTLFCVTSGAYSGTLWPATMATTPASGSGTLVTSYAVDVNPTGSVITSLYNLQPVYDITERVRLDLLVQRKDWDPAVVVTASTDTQCSILTECYYRVVDVLTNEEVVQFGTGSLQHTKLSYNNFSNYFYFDMSSLSVGPLYRFDFIYNVPTGSSEWTLIQGDAFKFRLTEVFDG